MGVVALMLFLSAPIGPDEILLKDEVFVQSIVNDRTSVMKQLVILDVCKPSDEYTLKSTNNQESKMNDLVIIKQKYLELLDAPRIEEGGVFPYNKEQVSDYLAFNYKFQTYINDYSCLNLDRARKCEIIKRETEYLYTVWNCLDTYYWDYASIYAKRVALKKLKQEIGEEAFKKGEMPPNVPYWRFNQIGN